MQQVGRAVAGYGAHHAFLWSGTKESAVNLQPSNWESSVANGVFAGRQVGSVSRRDEGRAIMWFGAPNTYVFLHPRGFTLSWANGIFGDEQVGAGEVSSRPTYTYGTQRALLWHGSAESFVDLTPRGWLRGEARATNGFQQVGYVEPGEYNVRNAAVWSETADSFVNLQAFLPPEYPWSEANAIDEFGNIVGTAWTGSGNVFRAVMWTPVPEPGTLAALALLAPLAFRRLLGFRGYK